MTYEDPDAMVLAGFVASEEQKIYFTEEVPKIYHLPCTKGMANLNTIRHLNKLKYFCPIMNGITDYFEIMDIKVIPRSEIFELSHRLYRSSDEPYFVLSLMNRKKLKNKIESSIGGNRVFRYAKISELIYGKNIK
jgi:hypothetical protein